MLFMDAPLIYDVIINLIYDVNKKEKIKSIYTQQIRTFLRIFIIIKLYHKHINTQVFLNIKYLTFLK